MSAERNVARMAVACLLGICCLVTPQALAQGSLTPPGPPAPGMRSLDQIEPRTPISSLPFSITQPGSYVVVGNLSSASGGISVEASDVTIDLNGFVLTGDPKRAGHGIIVVPSMRSVRVCNGALRNWGSDGIHAPGASEVSLRSLSVSGCVGDGGEVGSADIEDAVFSGNGGAGLRVGGDPSDLVIKFVVKKVAASGNGGGGIAYVGPCDASVFDASISGNTGHGVSWASTAPDQRARVHLERCVVSSNTLSGLHIEESSAVRVACSSRSTSFLGNGGDGLAVLLTHADAGLQLDLRDGAASGNGGCGMNVREGGCKDNGNVLVDFQFEANALDGAAKYDTLDAPSLCSRVVARGNGGRGLAFEGGTWTLEDCTVADNVADGVHVVMRTGHVTLIKFDGGDVARNGGDGVALVPDAPGGTYKVSMQDMHLRSNAGRGLALAGSCHVLADASSFLANSGHGLDWDASAAGQACRLALSRCEVSGNTLSGLHVEEALDVDVDCDFSSTVFDDNGGDGLALLLTHPDAGLAIVHRGGGASGNTGHGLNVAAGRDAQQGFFDVALSRNGGSGCNKIDAGPGPGTFERVVARNNGAQGLDLSGGTWSLSSCVVSDNTGGGVVYASRHVKTGHVTILKAHDCDVERNGGDGVHVFASEDDASYKVVFQDMHLRSNTGSGVHLSCDRALSSVTLDWLDSSASGNGACGLLIVPVVMDKGLRFRMQGGDCDDNVQAGVLVTDAGIRSGTLSAVSLRNNGGPGFSAPAGALRLERCVAAGNGGDGFLVTRAPASAVLSHWGDLDCDGCDAVHNGGSGLVVSGFDRSSSANVSVVGGQVCGNASNGVDLASSPGARGRVHAVHMGENRLHGLISSASGLSVTENQATGNGGSGLHVLAGAHYVARNVCTDNTTGVYLATTGSTVLQNTFGGGAGGALQVPVEDLTGASDVAPPQSAASGTNPLGNLVF